MAKKYVYEDLKNQLGAKKAILELKKAAEQGIREAQRVLGTCFYDGEGVKKDRKEAEKWHKKAAANNDVMATRLIGILNYNNEDSKKRKKEPVKASTKTKITLAVFEIKPVTEGVEVMDLPGNLYKALNKTDTIRERLMSLSSEIDNNDKDFISDFNYKQGYLFGSFVRLIEGEESTVKITSLDKKTVGLNEMITEAKEGSAGSIRSSGFFCIHDRYIIISSARLIRGALETYARWIVKEKTENEMQFNFSPIINTLKTIPLNEIQSIRFSDTFLNPENIVSKTSMKLSKTLFDTLISNVKTLHNMNIEDIVSAELILKINKTQLKKKNAKALETALRLVDSENIRITGSDGKQITGTSYLTSFVREFEKIGSVRFNERAIEMEMISILKAVKNGTMVS